MNTIGLAWFAAVVGGVVAVVAQRDDAVRWKK